MTRSRRSRSQRRAEDIDVTYEIEMPFEKEPAEINLIKQDDEIEVLISNIPVPRHYYLYSSEDRGDKSMLQRKAVARWILEDCARVLDEYDWESSSSRTNNPNYFLKDVYFTCHSAELDRAVLDAKKFLLTLEEKSFHHSERLGASREDSPSERLDLD